MDEIKTFNIRDKFAMSVISEIIRAQGQIPHSYRGCENILQDNCDLAYQIADAMLESRDKLFIDD